MTLDEVMSLAADYAATACGKTGSPLRPSDTPTRPYVPGSLRAAIEQYARGDAEPVAWPKEEQPDGSVVSVDPDDIDRPSRPLTDEQIEAIEQRYASILTAGGGLRQFARAVEMAHGITATAATEG